LYSILQACQKIKIYFALIFTSQIRSKSTLDIPRIIGLSFFSAVFSLITPVFFQAIGAAKVSVAISVMREIICLIPHFLAVVPSGAGVDLVGVPLSETISGEFGLVLYLRQIHRWPDV
jgi:Na+-driven multidrug efflux pump